MSPDLVDTAFKPEKGAGSDATKLALARFVASAVYSEIPPSPSLFVALMYRMLVLDDLTNTTSEILESVVQVETSPVVRLSCCHIVVGSCSSKE